MTDDTLDLDLIIRKALAQLTPVRQHVDRLEERAEANLLATIKLPDGTQIACVLRDVSKSGAKLGLPRGCTLPQHFMFKISGRPFVFQARLAWQRDNYGGVRIERIAKLAPNSAL